jgi:hypothetical protein
VASPQPSPRPDAAPPAPTADEQWAELERAAAVFRTAPPQKQRRQASGEGMMDLAPDSAAPAAAKPIPPLPPLPPAAATGGGRTPRTPRTPRTRLAQVVPLSAEDDVDGDDVTAQAGPPAGPTTPASPRRGRGGGAANAASGDDVAAGSLRVLGFASGTTRSADVAQRDAALHTARDALFAAQLAPRWPAARSGDHKAALTDDDPASRESDWVRALLALRRPARAVAADVARAALLGAYLLMGAAVAFAALYRVDGATGRIQAL